MEMPVTQLCNGMVVGNFCLPMELKFPSGEVLEGCEEDRVKELLLSKVYTPPGWKITDTIQAYLDIACPSVDFVMVPKVLHRAVEYAKLYGDIDADDWKNIRVYEFKS